MGYEDTKIECPSCGDSAYRVSVYENQFTICETGAVYGARDRVRRDHMGEKLEKLRKNSVETTKTSGKASGPFRLPESKTYGPK
jgi:hypothetical protein